MTGFAIVLRKRPAELERLIQRMVIKHRALIFWNEELMTGREPTVIIRTVNKEAAVELKEELSKYA